MTEPIDPETTPNNFSPQNKVNPSSKAVAALILGIFSLIMLGFLTGIPAFFIGRSEEKAIKRGAAPLSGQTAAKIGWILGLIGTILSCLLGGVIGIIIALENFYTSSSPTGF